MKKTKIDLIKLESEKEPPPSSPGEEAQHPVQGSKKKGFGAVFGNKKILIGGVAGLFLIGGALAGAGYLGYLSLPWVSHAQSTEAQKPKNLEVGEILKLSPMIVNLREGSGRNYLKTTIVLEIEKKAWVEEVQSKMPILTDVVLLTLSDKRIEDLRRLESKDQLKSELLNKMNQCLAPKRVKQIYFDEFLYQ